MLLARIIVTQDRNTACGNEVARLTWHFHHLIIEEYASVRFMNRLHRFLLPPCRIDLEPSQTHSTVTTTSSIRRLKRNQRRGLAMGWIASVIVLLEDAGNLRARK